MMDVNTLFLSISSLIIISIFIARVSNNLGVPIMLLFLMVGMLAGSEGPGGIYFDDPALAQHIGIAALVFILFSGGLSTHWSEVRPVLWPSLSLATVGVVITAAAVALLSHLLFEASWLISALLGAIVASTDAAAVFSIIGARKIKLKGKITPLLELESGSNDPMAVFLTISLLKIIGSNEVNYWALALDFVMEMGIGLAVGLILGKGIVMCINKLKIPIEGLYAVFVFATAFFVYSFCTLLHGSGFLAVYIAGMVVGNHPIVHKKNIFRFFDGIAWVSQVIMFITLGLLVYPSRIAAMFIPELALSLFLIFVARPLGVFVALMPFRWSFKEKLLISWVGLRGAVPIILATFPLLAHVAQAQWIFNVVFFIVITSALLQGWTIPFVAQLLGLKGPGKSWLSSPSEFSYLDQTDRKRIRLIVPKLWDKKSIVQLQELRDCLIVTIKRGDEYFIPSGGTLLYEGDVLESLVAENKFRELESLTRQVEGPQE